MEPANQPGLERRFIELLHEAPRVLEFSTPEALKNLSATCRSLRTSFCAQVTIIRLSDPEDVSEICCATWPQLLMIVCQTLSWPSRNLNRKLSDQWEYMMEMETLGAAVLIRSRQPLQSPLTDLSSRHFAALSHFADKTRHTTVRITLQGPLVCSRIIQSLVHTSLTSISIADSCCDAVMLLTMSKACPKLDKMLLCNNQLDNTTISSMTPVEWPCLASLFIEYSMLGAAGIRYLVSCSLPSLLLFGLRHAGIDRPALQCLSQGKWPKLSRLYLGGNNIDAFGVSCLVQGNWPLLQYMSLSPQGLDEEACSLLGIAKAERIVIVTQQINVLKSKLFQSHLPQFSRLKYSFLAPEVFLLK